MIEWIIWITTIFLSGISIGIYLRRYKKSDLLIGLYVLFLAAAQIIAAKIIVIGPFTVPASIFIYPFTLLLIDCIIEFFGKEEAYKAIVICFVTQVLMVLLLWLSIVTKPALFWELQPAWEIIFNLSIRITGASWIAFLACHLFDVYLFSKLRNWVLLKWREAKFPAIRAGIVDIPILALDSLIFVTLAFYGVFDISPLITGQIVTKWITGIGDSPIISLAKKIGYS
ncbi:MAG: queuosine precursor transporter [Thermoproteota archaeon]